VCIDISCFVSEVVYLFVLLIILSDERHSCFTPFHSKGITKDGRYFRLNCLSECFHLMYQLNPLYYSYFTPTCFGMTIPIQALNQLQ
jgi:hypothetical protein